MRSDVSYVRQDMLTEVLEGLRQPQKTLASKFFYDERGSELFEQITRLKEYYLTRSENQILKQNMGEMSSCIGSRPVVIELGSGSSRKTRRLLDHLNKVAAYVPVDISESYLLKVVRSLKKEYPKLLIKPVCADYTKPFDIPNIKQSFDRQVIFFPGSTIGNFEPKQAHDLLQMISGIMNPNDVLLIGVDLKKDRTILERAYNDKEGVTARFNKNMLIRLNRELGADFEINEFAHYAYYNKEQGRIEMHLVSQKNQTVHLDGRIIKFREGESIHTENSYKYSVRDFKELVDNWFRVNRVWNDDQNLFSLQYLEKR